jgi:hypothetical protein
MNVVGRFFSLSWFGAVLALSRVASAEVGEAEDPGQSASPPLKRFGAEDTLVLDGSVDLGRLTYDDSKSKRLSLNFAPSASWFVADHFSLGASLQLGYVHDEVPSAAFDSTHRTVGGGIGIGYDIPVSRFASMWFRFGGYLWHVSADLTQPPGGFRVVSGTPISGDYAETVVGMSFFAPILFHPARHVFMGIGPVAFSDVLHTIDEADAKRLYVGLSTIVGGWL